ncbi:MAG TPA: hypothetical protein EYM84_07860 [Flavobacteriales bacterium]|nr:hypothetical protein [Flavobacteriales bacterium]
MYVAKMIPRTINTVFFFSLILLLTSCYRMPVSYAASTTPIDPNNIKILGHAKGTSEYFSLFGMFPTRLFGMFPANKPDFNAAIEDAISNYKGGKALINVQCYSTLISFHNIGTLNILTVEGDVVGK